MAIKSKNIKKDTNSFAGLVSWLSMMLIIYAFACIAAGMFFIAFIPDITDDAGQVLDEIAHTEHLPYDVSMRIASSACLAITAIVLVFAFRKDRKQFEAGMSAFLAKIWVEVKLILIPAVILLFLSFDNFWLLLLIIICIIYLLCLDIGHNRTFFRRNIVRSILDTVNTDNSKSPYEKLSKKRLYSVLFVALGILIAAALFISLWSYLYYDANIPAANMVLILLGIIAFSLGGIIGAVSWYTINLQKDLRDLNEIMEQIEEMYGGNLNAVNHIPPTSNFYDSAMQLNMIRTGIEKAVEDGTKADRTKVELITNVSHDIKTPLTSIISYVELLKKDEELPAHIKDYVNTISNKADRLSHIVQDVFEVSKAATGNIALNMESLDITKLLHQTIAEMDEAMQAAPLNWRIDIPETPIMICADGQKLYRVFQNLIRNTAQYSLEGSRAYITLRQSNGIAEVTLRNIARTEMDSTAAEYLTGRFVRGDQNRTSEGSGLGLSIAKSFTEACGGTFSIRTDGDIFLVIVQFPAFLQPQPAQPPFDSLPETPPAGQVRTGTSAEPEQQVQYPVAHAVSISGYPAPPSAPDPSTIPVPDIEQSIKNK